MSFALSEHSLKIEPRKMRCFSIIDHQKHVLFDKLHFPYRHFTYARALCPFWNGQKHVCFDRLYLRRCRFTLARAIFLFRNHQKHVLFVSFDLTTKWRFTRARASFLKPGRRTHRIFPTFLKQGFNFRRKTRRFSQLGFSIPCKIPCFLIADHQKHKRFDRFHSQLP